VLSAINGKSHIWVIEDWDQYSGARQAANLLPQNFAFDDHWIKQLVPILLIQ